jgi:hypothetical protein
VISRTLQRARSVFRDAVRAFTPAPLKRYAKLMPLREGIVELRENGASLRLSAD